MYTTTVKTTRGSGTNRGRGRGRGRQSRHNFTFSRPSIPDEEVYEDYTHNQRRRGSSVFPQNQRHNQPSNRNQSNYRDNKNGNNKSYRSDNTERNSPTPNSNSSGIPKHAQTPFFVGELMSRFNNMLPTPMLFEDAVGAQQPKVSSNPKPVPHIHTLDTIKNNNGTRDSNSSSNKNNGFHNGNGNMNKNTNHKDEPFKMGSNSNKEKHSPPQTGFNYEESSGRGGRTENLRMSDNSNRSNVSTGSNDRTNSNLECPSDVNNRKTSSNKSNNSQIKKKVPLEKRKEIMKSFGFDINTSENKNPDTSKDVTTDKDYQGLPQTLPHGQIASRTTPRVRHNLQNETCQKILPGSTCEEIEKENLKFQPENQRPQDYSLLDLFMANVEKCRNTRSGGISPYNVTPNSQNANTANSSPGKSSGINLVNSTKVNAGNTSQQSGISDELFAQLDTFERFNSNKPTQAQYKTSVEKLKSDRQVSRNTHSNKVHNFKPLHNTIPVSQDYPERSNSRGQRTQKPAYSDRSRESVSFLNNPGLIETGVAGRSHFNVNRPVRDYNEIVPSREEALDKLQEQYEIQRALHETKEKEKEAKKREEYLARYKHVDQGHRLNEGLLDEAAGYAPGFDPYETEEYVRHRQQEQLRLDALAYQERMREEQEKQKRKEEEKVKERQEKNKHINVGYRLGKENSQGPGFEPYETVEYVRQRQQEQLRQNALAYQEQMREQQENQKRKEEEKVKESQEKNKHFNAGYRLGKENSQGPGFEPYETEEYVRQRQQEQLRQNALAYQEQMREQQEKQKRKEEEKVKGRQEKNKYFNVGYRVGHENNQEPFGVFRSTVASKKKKNSHKTGRSNEKGSRNSISPELLLEGETEEEALQRQEEQLILEMLILNQMELQKRNRETFENDECFNENEDDQAQSSEECFNENEDDQAQSSEDPVAINLCKRTHTVTEASPNPPTTTAVGLAPKTSEQGLSRHIAPSQLNQAASFPNVKPTEYPVNVEKVHAQIRNVDTNITIKDPKPSATPDHSGTKRQSQSLQSEEMGFKVSRSSVVQVPAVNCEPSAKKPASCILKNQNGAVLVLRPTAEELNRTLARKLEVHEEMDKLGYSTQYEPQVEQALYSNNRYDRKSSFDAVKPTGAIPKNSSSLAVRATSSVGADNSLKKNETPKEEVPAIDHKAELRAARLRFQQQYEETLKKKQQQMDKS